MFKINEESEQKSIQEFQEKNRYLIKNEFIYKGGCAQVVCTVL